MWILTSHKICDNFDGAIFELHQDFDQRGEVFGALGRSDEPSDQRALVVHTPETPITITAGTFLHEEADRYD